MPLTLHRIIMHRINKTQHIANASTVFRESPFNASVTLNRLLA